MHEAGVKLCAGTETRKQHSPYHDSLPSLLSQPDPSFSLHTAQRILIWDRLFSCWHVGSWNLALPHYTIPLQEGITNSTITAHRTHNIQASERCIQECVWPSQTQTVPKGVSLLLNLTLENNCTQWAVLFPQTSLSQSPPPPNSISNRRLGLIHLVTNQNQPLGLKQN